MKKLYIDICRAANIVFYYGSDESEEYWKCLCKGKKEVYNIDRPHPIEYAKECGNRIQKENIIALNKSLQNINEERNVISSLFVASNLQNKYNFE